MPLQDGYGFSFPHNNFKSALEKKFINNHDDGYEDGIRPLMKELPIALVDYQQDDWQCYVDDTTRVKQEPFNEPLYILLMHLCGCK